MTADKFNVPASAAGALSGVEWVEPLTVIHPNWPAAVPPISIATLPPAKWVNPPDIENLSRDVLPRKLHLACNAPI